MHNLIKLKNNKGFTIIETLVAVAILMISIAGPLTIAQKGLTAAIYARDQITAAFLAQENMELIRSNIDSLNLANFTTNVVDQNFCSSSNTYGLLNIQTTDGKYGSLDGVPSRFSRLFCFKRMATDDVNYENEFTAVVKVKWSNGTVENEVILENELFKI